MYVHTHTYIYIYIYIYMCVCVHYHTFACMGENVCTRVSYDYLRRKYFPIARQILKVAGVLAFCQKLTAKQKDI